ncbi:MAG: hypothetical protein EXR49_06410 [Dehalococcoidia bacterium]|nr:hypothetical protein [Dehalococcoidia bacterium]
MKITIGKAVLHVRMDTKPALEDDLRKFLSEEKLPQMLSVPGFLSARLFHGIASAGQGLPGTLKDWVPGHHRWLAMVELEDERVLQSQEYLQMRRKLSATAKRLLPQVTMVRNVHIQQFPEKGALLPGGGSSAQQPVGEVTLMVLAKLEPAWHEEVNQWYDKNHLAHKLTLPGHLSGRRLLRGTDASWMDTRGMSPDLSAAWYSAAEQEPRPHQILATYEQATEEAAFHREPPPAVPDEWSKKVSAHFTWFRTIYRRVWPEGS